MFRTSFVVVIVLFLCLSFCVARLMKEYYHHRMIPQAEFKQMEKIFQKVFREQKTHDNKALNRSRESSVFKESSQPVAARLTLSLAFNSGSPGSRTPLVQPKPVRRSH